MAGVESSLALVVDHGTFLLLSLPVIGALLVLLSSPWGAEIVFRTTLVNVGFSIAVAALMVIRFDTTPPEEDAAEIPRYQMASETGLERSPARSSKDESARGDSEEPPPHDDVPEQPKRKRVLFRIAVGVDGISLWLVALIPPMMLAALQHARGARNLAGLCGLLLLLQAALTGVFAAVNVVFFLVCLEAAVVLLFVLIGCWGDPDHRREAVPLAVLQLAGSLLVMFGLISLVVAHYWLTVGGVGDDSTFTSSFVLLAADLPPQKKGLAPLVAEYWSSAEALIFWSLFLGFAITSAVFPFHSRFCSATAAWPGFVGVPAYALWPCVGVYGFLRLAGSTCPNALASHGPMLAACLLGGAVYCGLLALGQSDFKRTVAYASAAHVGLALAVAVTHSPAGIAAAMFHLISHLAGFALLAGIVAAISNRYETLEIRAFSGLGKRLPWIAAVYFAAVLAVCGVPGLSGFPALWQTMLGFSESATSGRTAVGFAIAAVAVEAFILWAFLAAGQRIFWGPLREPLREPAFGGLTTAGGGSHAAEPRRPDGDDWKGGDLAAALLLVGVLVVVGIAPQFVAERVGPALKSISVFEPADTAAQTPAGMTAPNKSTFPVVRGSPPVVHGSPDPAHPDRPIMSRAFNGQRRRRKGAGR